jgi:hypothetical protein
VHAARRYRNTLNFNHTEIENAVLHARALTAYWSAYIDGWEDANGESWQNCVLKIGGVSFFHDQPTPQTAAKQDATWLLNIFKDLLARAGFTRAPNTQTTAHTRTILDKVLGDDTLPTTDRAFVDACKALKLRLERDKRATFDLEQMASRCMHSDDFYRENGVPTPCEFYAKLDSVRHLVGFNNGILDLRAMVFYTRREPEMYVSGDTRLDRGGRERCERAAGSALPRADGGCLAPRSDAGLSVHGA